MRKKNHLIQLSFLTKLRSISSGTLLDELQRALAALWENITGALLIVNASLMVLIETWDKSTSIPNRFNSFTTALPNIDNPSLWKSNRASEFGSSTEQESALWMIATIGSSLLYLYIYLRMCVCSSMYFSYFFALVYSYIILPWSITFMCQGHVSCS